MASRGGLALQKGPIARSSHATFRSPLLISHRCRNRRVVARAEDESANVESASEEENVKVVEEEDPENDKVGEPYKKFRNPAVTGLNKKPWLGFDKKNPRQTTKLARRPYCLGPYVQQVSKKHMRDDLPEFKVGHTYRVEIVKRDGDDPKSEAINAQSKRLGAFEGIMIRRQNKMSTTSILLRGHHVTTPKEDMLELNFPIHSPKFKFTKVPIPGIPIVRGNRPYYLKRLPVNKPLVEYWKPWEGEKPPVRPNRIRMTYSWRRDRKHRVPKRLKKRNWFRFDADRWLDPDSRHADMRIKNIRAHHSSYSKVPAPLSERAKKKAKFKIRVAREAKEKAAGPPPYRRPHW